jgi:tetratricopeptide (TPR) repeat protein
MAFIQPPRKNQQGVARRQPEIEKSILSTESPFIDRQHAFDRIRSFISQQETAFVLSGMRGIGKSSLIQEAFRQVIPPRRINSVKLTEGISYPRLLAELAFGFNLRMPENLDLATADKQTELEQRIKSHISRGQAAVIVLDEFQHLLNGAGEIEGSSIKQLILGLLEAGAKSRTKVFLISDLAPKFDPEIEAYCASYKLQGLVSEDTKRLLLYWFQFGREDLSGQPLIPSERTVSLLGGHPLATKVAAQLWAEHPSQDISKDMAIFERLRDTIVPFILEKIALSSGETDLLLFASIFRLPVSREVFLRWKGDEAGYLLSSLASQYLIESSERGYELHPLVRDFFYHKLPLTQAMEFHKIAGKFYAELFEKARIATKQLVPEYLGEAVHHFLAAGDRKRVQSLAFYGQELKPVALSHYRRKEFKIAMKDYQVLVELDDKDVDAHFHLALLHARNESWPDAEFHYGRAIELRPRAAWIIQGFANAKLRVGKTEEAEQLLSEAEEINPRHAGTLVDLGRIRERQGHYADAEDYYRRAIDASPDYSFAYYQLAALLYREGQVGEAYDMARAAMATQPLDSRNKALVEELRQKMEGFGQSTAV